MKTKPSKKAKDNEAEEISQNIPVIQNQHKRSLVGPLVGSTKGFSISSIRNEKKKKETCEKLIFVHMGERNLTSEDNRDLVQMFADSSKTVKHVFLIFPALTKNLLKTLDKCFNKNLSSLKSLSFHISSSCSGITLGGLNRLISIIKRQASLQKISFDLNLCETLSHSICQNLMSTLKRVAGLKKLHLNFRKNCLQADHSPITDKFIENIHTVIQKQKQLEDFVCNLSPNKDESAEAISDCKVKDLLMSLEQLPSLKNFGYQVRGIKGMKDYQFKQYWACVKNLKNLRSLEMDFSGSSISNLGMTAISASLKQLSLLHTINLNFSGGVSITAECVKTVMNGCSKLPALRKISLYLSGSWSINDAALLNISKALAKMTNLLDFGLFLEMNHQITSEGLNNLGKSLQKLESLKNLHLSFSMCQQIKNQDLTQIIAALKKMSVLENFELLINHCRQVNGQLLTDVLENLANSKSLEALTINLKACDITNDHLKNLKTAFKKVSCLRRFGLSLDECDKITLDGFQSLIQALFQLASLQNLVFGFGRVVFFDRLLLSLKNLIFQLPYLRSILLSFSHFSLNSSETRMVEELRNSFPSKQIFLLD